MARFNRLSVSQRVRRAVAQLAVGGALLLAPGAAQALGKITGLTVNPGTVQVGQSVSITVSGIGVCDGLEIAYGDGQKTTHANVSFLAANTLNVTHKYTTAGSKNVQAQGTAACADSKSANVQVKGQLRPPPSGGRGGKKNPMGANDPSNWEVPDELKKPWEAGDKSMKPGLVNDGVVQFLKPKITGYFAVPLGAATNGTKVFLKGQGFGTKKGKIRMFLGGGPAIELAQLEWVSASNVRGVIPNSVVACGEDKVEFQVVTSVNKTSNKWKTGWKQGGKQKTVQLAATDSVIKVIHCGKDGNWNACNQKNSQNHVKYSTTLDTSGTGCDLTKSICGWHKNQWGAVGNDKGTDKFQIKLKNGWKFASGDAKSWKSSNDEKINGPSPQMPVGESEWAPSWSWEVTPADDINYEAIIKITGPKACPYK